MLNESKYITTVPFSGLFNWSVQYLNETKISFNTAYPMVRIGDFLERNKTAITIENSKSYKRATIKVRNGGVFLRDEEIGTKIGTKNQFLISEGQFLLSKIDARNGAFGVVDATIFVIDVAEGDKIPRKGGPGITRSDLLVINKIDLAPYVGAGIEVMAHDSQRMRGDKPFLFTNIRDRVGLEEVMSWIKRQVLLEDIK